jgi:mercuric ion binding protein
MRHWNQAVLHSLALSALLASPAFASAKEIQIKVQGMVCSFCAQGIQKKLSAEPGVAKVDVKLADHLVTVTTLGDQDVADPRLEEILKDAGYNVAGITRK